MNDPIRITLEELCKAVAEEMGFVWNGDYFLTKSGMRAYTYDKNYFATGNGMLEVLEWLYEKREECISMEYGVIPFQHPRKALAYCNNSLLEKDVVPNHNSLPTAVLLAFMKAVRGVDVEVLES